MLSIRKYVTKSLVVHQCSLPAYFFGFVNMGTAMEDIMTGAEGRRDAFLDIFLHLKKAPDVIFYDFACSLSEYCLNREPVIFKATRFFVDKFHIANHTFFIFHP